MRTEKKSKAHSGAQQCEWMPANEAIGVQPIPHTADFSVDLISRVPQLVPFLLKLILELMNIFVCAHTPNLDSLPPHHEAGYPHALIN
jgi:hypothetical protein